MTRFPNLFPYLIMDQYMPALQPQRVETHWFGLVRVRSPLLPESLLISSPGGTEMFHFPPFASKSLCIQLKDT